MAIAGRASGGGGRSPLTMTTRAPYIDQTGDVGGGRVGGPACPDELTPAHAIRRRSHWRRRTAALLGRAPKGTKSSMVREPSRFRATWSVTGRWDLCASSRPAGGSPASLLERRIPMRKESLGCADKDRQDGPSTGVITGMKARNASSRAAPTGRVWRLLLLGLLSACSARHSTGAAQPDEPLPECDAFLASYRHCLESLGPPDIARGRVEQSRASFESIHGESARVELRLKCADNLVQLKKTCR